MNSNQQSQTNTSHLKPAAPLAQFRKMPHRQHPHDQTVDSILDAIAGIQYGNLVVSIQDGHLVQIDRLERFRLSQAKSGNLTRNLEKVD